MGTAAARSTAESESLGARGEAYGIPSEQVDGMDVRAVKDAADRAMEHCRSGAGPYILEMMTYRYRGHSMSDPAKYRSKEEVEKYKEERDPITNFRKYLEKAGIGIIQIDEPALREGLPLKQCIDQLTGTVLLALHCRVRALLFFTALNARMVGRTVEAT